MSWKKKQAKLRERVFKASGAKSLSSFDKQVTRAAVGLTSEEALFLLADKYKVREVRGFEKLSPESKHRVSNMIHNVTTNTTKNININKRVLQITNSQVGNLNAGDNNTINQKIGVLADELVSLAALVNSSKNLSEDERVDFESDIQTIAAQASKTNPNNGIIKTAWKSIGALSDVEGFSQALSRLAPLIQALFS